MDVAGLKNIERKRGYIKQGMSPYCCIIELMQNHGRRSRGCFRVGQSFHHYYVELQNMREEGLHRAAGSSRCVITE